MFYREDHTRMVLKLYQSEGLSGLIKVRIGGNRNTVLSKNVLAFIEQQLKNPQTTITSYIELQ